MYLSTKATGPDPARLRAAAVPAVLLAALVLGVADLPAEGPEDLRGKTRELLRQPSYLGKLGLEPASPPPGLNLQPRAESRAAFDRLAAGGPWRVDWDAGEGTPIMVTGAAAGPYPGSPEAAARAFLRDYAALFNLDVVPEGALRASESLTSRSGEHVSFVQYHRGLPVFGGVISVLVDGDNFIRMASGGFLPVPETTPDMRLSADEAIRSVARHLEPGAEMARDVSPVAPLTGVPGDAVLEYGADAILPAGLIALGRVRGAWYPAGDGWRVTWMTDVAPGDNPRAFRVLVDGVTGEPVHSEMLTKETHETIRVYRLNPDKSGLTDETIRDVDKPSVGGPLNGAFTRMLNSQAAVIADAPYNHSTDPNDPTVDLNFDEQNVFYHDNLIRQFFVDLNGGPNFGTINLDSNKLDSRVHLVDGGNPDADNAFYEPLFDRTSFGHGSFHLGTIFGLRDFALEESVVYHEFSHRVNDNVAGFGGTVYGGAANEAVADYWAATFTNDKYVGEFANADPESGDDSGWLGFHGFIRSMENDRVYSQICDNPFVAVTIAGCTGGAEVHSDGEILGGALWDMRRALMEALGPAQGVSTSDSLVLEAVFNMSGGGALDTDDFIETRNALLTADATLFGGQFECLIWQVFAAREMGDGATNTIPPAVSTALPAACLGAAALEFSKQSFSCAGPDSGLLTVNDPDGGAVTTVTVTSASGDSETFSLTWNGTTATTPSFDVDVAPPTMGNGVVEVSVENEPILAAYADDSPAKTVNAFATVDCTPALEYVSHRVFNGSCDAEDPFLDAGESALMAVTLRSTEEVATLSGLEVTLNSSCGDVTVDSPATRTLPDLEPGAEVEVNWAIVGGGAIAPGASCDHTITVGGSGITGADEPIAFSQTLESDLSYTPQVSMWDFVTGEEGFTHFDNGGGDTWHHQTDSCASPPNAGYWKVGPNGCTQRYSIGESSWLASPWVRIHLPDAEFPSRVTALKWKHRVHFGTQAGAAPFIQGDQFDVGANLQQVVDSSQQFVFYDFDDNDPSFLQQDIDLTGSSFAGLDLSHGWVRFLWLFIANNTGTGGFVCCTGWYIDDVEIHWEEPSPVADTNDPGVCAPDVTLSGTYTPEEPAPTQGNGDGIIDPGEIVTVAASLSNSGTGTANSVAATLTSDRPDIITITNDTTSFPNILPLDTEASQGTPFTFVVDPAATCGDVVNFTVTVDHNGVPGALVEGFSITLGSLAVLFSDDFETDTGVWTVNASGTDTATAGQWERVDPVQWCYDGDCVNNNETQPGDDFDPGTSTGMCFVTESGDGDATFNLNDVDDGPTTFESSNFDLSASVDPIVSYARHVYNRDGNSFDAFVAEVSTDGGGSWTTLESVFDANGIPNNPVTNFWQEVSFLLSSFVVTPQTSTVKFRFTAQDNPDGGGLGQIIEAAVDKFQIRDSIPVCNVFVPPAPPEVSPPGAATPFTVGRTGTNLDLAWESTPGATSYRIISGDLFSLQASGGVTTANADPLICGIVPTSASGPEPAGSVFVLVAGEAAAVGPLGNASSGAPRQAGTICP